MLRVFGNLLLSLVALIIYFVMFELRYMWFVGRADYLMLRFCSAVSIFLIAGLWAVFPSLWLVTGIAVAWMVFPAVYAPHTFVPVDAAFLLFWLPGLGLLAGCTYLWRARRAKKPVRP